MLGRVRRHIGQGRFVQGTHFPRDALSKKKTFRDTPSWYHRSTSCVLSNRMAKIEIGWHLPLNSSFHQLIQKTKSADFGAFRWPLYPSSCFWGILFCLIYSLFKKCWIFKYAIVHRNFFKYRDSSLVHSSKAMYSWLCNISLSYTGRRPFTAWETKSSRCRHREIRHT